MADDTFGSTSLHISDLIVIIGYFIFVLFVGLWTSRQNRGSAGGYFLAGRNMNWIPVGASLFASNIGSLHFVGLAGSGAASGIAIGCYELNAMFVVLILGYVFLPVYISSGVYTMPEYLKRRFGGLRIQIYMAVLALLVYIFTKISADLYAGALFIEQSLGWDIYPSILLLLAIAAIFTVTGGLTAVMWTDLIQTVIMLIGAFVLMGFSFHRVGGLSGLITHYPMAIPNTTLASNSSCGYPRKDYMNLLRDPLEGDLPWPGLVGVTINSIWYWCADQVIVQRALAGKTYDHSKMGTILCGFLKILPLFLLVFPGMIARILFVDSVGCADPEVCLAVCGSRSGCTNIAYPTMVINLLPAGARGMMLAVMMSALMSSLTSIFNSSSTIFAMDIWTRIRRKASELEVMVVGRVFVLILVIISIIWIPVLKASQGSELYVYIQEVSSFLQPPICAVFLLGLFWERFNEKGAFVSLVVGMAIGLIRFVVQYSYTVPDCNSTEPDPTPAIIKNVHYLYFSSLLFIITGLCGMVVTLMTAPIDKRCIQRLTWWSRHSKNACWDVNEWSRDPNAYAVKMSSKRTSVTEGINGHVSNEPNDTEAAMLHKSQDVEKESEINKETRSEVEDVKIMKFIAPDILLEDHHSKILGQGPSLPRRVCMWVCGVEHSGKSKTLAEHRIQQEDMVSIEEEPLWRTISNSSAILLLLFATFILGYFA